MKKFLIFAFIGLFLVISAWLGRSTYHDYKEKRAIRQAEAFLEKKEYSSAMLSARQALQLNSNNIVACRMMAYVAEIGGSPHAIGWRQRIVELEPTVDNKIILVACALRFEPAPYRLATSVLNEIATEGASLAAYHVVKSKLALQLNDLAMAEKHLSEANRLDPENESNQLNLAAIHLRSSDAAKATEARQTLEQLRNSEKFGADALRWLLRDREERRNYREALDYSEALIARNDGQEADRLQHLTLLHRSGNAGFANYLGDLQEKAGTNAVDVYKVAAWQIASEMPEQALTWLDSLPAKTQAEHPVPVVRADALAAMKKWSELTNYLRSQKWNDEDFLRLALLAHALNQQNETDAAQANWSRAVRAASEKAEQLSTLSQLSGKWGWESETESVLWLIAENFPEQNWALESINRVYEANKNTVGLLRVFETRMKRNSADTLSRNNVAMISMLLKTNLSSAHLLAEQVYKSDTNNWGFVSTYAYSLHAQGKTQEALRLVQSLEPEQLKHPSLAAYYVILLSAAGEKEKAREYLVMAERANILPEEKELLQEAKKAL